EIHVDLKVAFRVDPYMSAISAYELTSRLAEHGKGRARHRERLGQGVSGRLRTEIGEQNLACRFFADTPPRAHEQQFAEALGARPGPRSRAQIPKGYRERAQHVGPQHGHAKMIGVSGSRGYGRGSSSP